MLEPVTGLFGKQAKKVGPAFLPAPAANLFRDLTRARRSNFYFSNTSFRIAVLPLASSLQT